MNIDIDIDKYRYLFKPMKGYWFTSYLLKSIYGKTGCFETTLDIGVSNREVCIVNNVINIDDNAIDLNNVKPRADDHVVFYSISDKSIYEVVRATSIGYYKLKAIGLNKAPTVEISGIHMHRIINIDPWIDSYLKVRKLGVRRGDIILDTCLGLGYTVINSLRKGASLVYSVEIDSNVLWIAEHNPWSRGLENNRVVIIQGDVVEITSLFPDNYFDKVLHDPPRYSSLTGDLYSLDFYRELYRVLKPGGKLYHYTGEPRKHGLPSIVKGIGDRLRKTGFIIIKYDSLTNGYIVYKPRS